MTAPLPLSRILAAHLAVLVLMAITVATAASFRPAASHPHTLTGPTRILTEAQP
ncbi:hypothetical protein [Methylobacterium nodulans]|uniref:Uncharacterized protein n=1 Tax=Methylobacterium nodulans (strain LMG 21967 / CNCM I-2342 / ORS 2060) TaxID=460265 RepID=B8IRS0_METNO|nr:hypothetical protein [Methylobacterium nodulans]ACL60620.1 hypothetical protein Mnod_5791 [Methylobacterium nodulans ORS 2060]